MERKAPSWSDAIKRVARSLPRVGNFVIHGKDPMCQDFHMLVPELKVKLVVLCRGTEKYRTPGSHAEHQDMPWRKTILVSRDDGSIVDLGPPENWVRLSKLQQTRKAGSARISVTVFGEKSDGVSDHQQSAVPVADRSVQNVLPPLESIETGREELSSQNVDPNDKEDNHPVALLPAPSARSNKGCKGRHG